MAGRLSERRSGSAAPSRADLRAGSAGLARVLSLPPDRDSFSSPWLDSYRVRQGVLHNPRNDRRTTQGVFHIAEGGLPIPADKLAVPRGVFARLLEAALSRRFSADFPFTAGSEEIPCGVVCLAAHSSAGLARHRHGSREKTMEIRFFAPGGLVSNLDFVESIFGNAGDPRPSENDAALDVMHWTGHSGCVILAPHLTGLTKASLGLPPAKHATERQRRDGMCWKTEDELYNGGSAFKICARDHRASWSLLSRTTITGTARRKSRPRSATRPIYLAGCEEEHAGGAMAFASYILGREFDASRAISIRPTRFERAMEILGDRVERKPEGYAIDRKFPTSYMFRRTRSSIWMRDSHLGADGVESGLSLGASTTWVHPSGFRVRLAKQTTGPLWRLVGARARGVLCHKPCTVSGGGKSEISKSLANAILHGPVFVADYQRDFDEVTGILRQGLLGHL